MVSLELIQIAKINKRGISCIFLVICFMNSGLFFCHGKNLNKEICKGAAGKEDHVTHQQERRPLGQFPANFMWILLLKKN